MQTDEELAPFALSSSDTVLVPGASVKELVICSDHSADLIGNQGLENEVYWEVVARLSLANL